MTLVLALSVIVAACGNDESSSKKESGSEAAVQELRVLKSSEIPSMDSVMATDATSFTILGNINEGLYSLNENNELVPAVAEGDPEVNEEGTEFTVTLKDGVEWANGDPVTAADFVYAWQRAIDPENASPYGPYMMENKILGATEITEAAAAGQAYDLNSLGVEAVDETKLVVKTASPMTVDFFKGLMAFGTFYPQNQAFVEAHGDKYATSAETVLSNGPFKMTSWKGPTATEWELEKNENYWDADNVSLTKIIFNVSKESQSAVNAIEAGEADITDKLSSDIVPQYEGDERMVSWLDPRLTWVKLNQENEALANENSLWGFFCTWNGEFVLNGDSYSSEYTEESVLKKYYANDFVITRDELPKF